MQTFDYSKHGKEQTVLKQRRLLPPGILYGICAMLSPTIPILGIFCTAGVINFLNDFGYSTSARSETVLVWILMLATLILQLMLASRLQVDLDRRRAITFDRCVAWLMWSTGLFVLCVMAAFVFIFTGYSC